ncbi:MAG: PorV/PorQ family protein [Flavobacteriales bacterium]|nr:PorV/PorQ family protein [Flavobacteriales bacterium]NQX96337.1 PorV/PorQ family protein [Flavobacteriales bacterium]
MKKLKLIIVLFSLYSISVNAGNEDRAGEAGASQLLINPWTKSVGWGGANSASVTGLEAMSLNIAGLAFTRKTELLVNHKRYFVGSDIGINSFGISQKIGETNVIGISVMSMDFGDIDVTTEDIPEGGIGTFSPKYTVMDIGFAKTFSNSISGGLGVRIISESIANISSRGFAFDAGVRYVTGDNDQIKFGIALKNVGPTMKASGDGLTLSVGSLNSNGNLVIASKNHRVAEFQLPSLLNIGASYDFYISPKIDSTSKEISADHKITVAANFTSNSFTKDQYRLGVEYSFRSMFQLRGGYVLEQNTWFDSEKRTTAYTGPAFGASFIAPLGKKGTTLGIHYAYQMTENFSGTHSIGLRVDL